MSVIWRKPVLTDAVSVVSLTALVNSVSSAWPRQVTTADKVRGMWKNMTLSNNKRNQKSAVQSMDYSAVIWVHHGISTRSVLPVPRFSRPIGRFFRLIGRAIFGSSRLWFFGRFRNLLRVLGYRSFGREPMVS